MTHSNGTARYIVVGWIKHAAMRPLLAIQMLNYRCICQHEYDYIII